MSKFVEMLTKVLDTKASQSLVGQEAEVVFEQYFQEVSKPLNALEKEQRVAVEEHRFVMCR